MKPGKLSLIALLLAFVFILLSLMPTSGESGIYGRMIRLHILAESDSEADQTVKLLVRDRILEIAEAYENSGELTASAGIAEAKSFVEEHLGELKDAATDVLRANGSQSEVTVTLSEEYYETRKYDGFSLPAGRYLSLRILIGKAEGKNWWCVLYPPLCISSAKVSAKDKLKTAGFTPDQIGFITESNNPGYRIRFRIVELLGELKNLLFP